MKFRVSRTSYEPGDPPPCPGAFTETVLDSGHSIKAWMIELNSLEELVGFAARHDGRLVLSFESYSYYDFENGKPFKRRPGDLPSLEIYDYWRE